MKTLLLSLLFISQPLLSAPPNDYEKIFQNIDHISVQFNQVIYKKLRDRKIERSGKAFFSKPNYFRWDFDDSQLGSEEFYYDGKTLTHFREKEALVTNYNANIGLARELNEVVNLVLEPKTLFTRYDVQVLSEGKHATHLKLNPRAGLATEIDHIQVKASVQRKYVKDIKIVYMDGNYTHFNFKNPRFSPNNLDIFKFSKKGAFTVRNHG